MTGGKPGEDLGIGWGAQESKETDALDVGTAREWEDERDVADGEQGDTHDPQDADQTVDREEGAPA